jgi:hypothetical protein
MKTLAARQAAALLACAMIAVALALTCGCSSSSGPTAAGGCDGSSCQDAALTQDTGPSSDTGAPSDASQSGDGPHDGGAPDALYGACATTGGFGWPCSATASGPDPTDCTDPSYPDCFVGGQGAWCTKTCGGNADCTTGARDAGCVPTTCNTKGYCK